MPAGEPRHDRVECLSPGQTASRPRACGPLELECPERWVRSVKEECLSKVILFGERSLRRALSERNHQGRTTSCCSLAIQTSTARGLCNAASDWVGSCAITIKARPDRMPKVSSRTLIPPLRSGDRRKRLPRRCPKSGAWVSFLNYRFFRPLQFFDHTGSSRNSRGRSIAAAGRRTGSSSKTRMPCGEA
jgi:hypothetical protein